MRIHNLYADADGETHFRDIEVDWAEKAPWGKLSKRLAATSIIFAEATADYHYESHPAPCRQYVITLDDGIEVTTSDGEHRVFSAGEVVLVEDTSGKGHVTKMFGGKPRNAVFIPVD